jgi:pimeloyl-ACP methyl ester carboxylesterase
MAGLVQLKPTVMGPPIEDRHELIHGKRGAIPAAAHDAILAEPRCAPLRLRGIALSLRRMKRRFLPRALLATSLILSTCLGLGSVACAAPKPPPLRVDLDAFDAMKKKVALPDGEVLAYVDTGNLAGPPVVLIHGYTDSARDWVPMLPYLSKRFRLILVDIRGHGQSSKPECCYTRIDFAYDIKLLMDALSVQRADIVGHSLGSIIAQTFAEYWPERTRRVVLISSTGGQPPGSSRPPQFDFAAQIRKLEEPIDPDSAFMIAWWDSPTPVDPDFIRRQRKDSAAIPLKVWLAVLDQGLPSSNAYGDLQRTLPRLKAPTLLIWGSRDPIMEEPVRKTLRDALPAAQVKIFEGLGHNPFWEDPTGVARVVNQFLESKVP